MWQSIIKIAYLPEFSPSFKKFIKDNVSPEFTSEDGDKHQYFVGGIEEAMEESELTFMEGDRTLIGQLFKNKIEYVEF